jgi:hypothetical protein
MTCPLTFEQLSYALYDSIHDDEPHDAQMAWAALILCYYPEQFDKLQVLLDASIAVGGNRNDVARVIGAVNEGVA